MYLMILIIFLISLILIILNLSISKKTFLDREKSSPFECGFDIMSSSRMPFSLQFFIITIIFIIFDVEIAILIPLLASMKLSYYKHLILIISFLIILLMGIYYEWISNSLNWLN